jgi:hypothetical protein
MLLRDVPIRESLRPWDAKYPVSTAAEVLNHEWLVMREIVAVRYRSSFARLAAWRYLLDPSSDFRLV